MVPENIHTTTTTEGSWPPLPPWIFQFFRKTVTPLPSVCSINMIKTPHPLWKVYSFGKKKKTIKNSKHKYGRHVLLRSVMKASINIPSEWNNKSNLENFNNSWTSQLIAFHKCLFYQVERTERPTNTMAGKFHCQYKMYGFSSSFFFNYFWVTILHANWCMHACIY